ncbi:MAG: NAD(P)H-dependent glycerol-3-phosphate dehydrogenase [Gemmobacter sp.]
MTGIAVLGAGAFGAALAVALGQMGPVTLWGRRGTVQPGTLPQSVTCTTDLGTVTAETLLIAVPMQALSGFLAEHGAALRGRALVACCKGVDLASGRGPTAVIGGACPGSVVAVLTGPGFAADIARGLPTALTLACADDAAGAALQRQLSTPGLRLYRSTDVTGAELGGALKNVVAIAAGAVIGAGLGDSARAALMTRGYGEMMRFALAQGARAETLAGLSGFGDLVLTCTAPQSRNFRHGLALARGEAVDPAVTVEGVATAEAVAGMAAAAGIDMPVTAAVAALCRGLVTVAEAVENLLARPLKPE